MSTTGTVGKPMKKKTDPVFVFMVVAVMLALLSSLALRAVVGGFGPQSARASQVNQPVAPSR